MARLSHLDKLQFPLLSVIVLFQCYQPDVKAITTISHPKEALACSGDQLELMCTTTTTFLQWCISIPNGTDSRTYDRTLTAGSQEWQIQDNLATFTFSVINGNGLTLTSRLLIRPISDGLNRTEVNCVDDDDTSSSIINIIGTAATPSEQETSISVRLEQFESDGVMTILEWTQENSLYSYYVTVTPDMEMWINGSASINLKLMVPYNTSHNVSVVAMPPCTKDSVKVTRFIELYYTYGYCGNPGDRVLDNSVSVTEYTIPVVIGTNVTFSCIPGLALSGPMFSTCMINGEWGPDPREVHCIGRVTEIVTDIDGQQTFTLSQNVMTAVVSAIISVVTLIIGLVIGTLCGHFCRKQTKKVVSATSETVLQNDLALNQKFYENALELQKNASYASVQ